MNKFTASDIKDDGLYWVYSINDDLGELYSCCRVSKLTSKSELSANIEKTLKRLNNPLQKVKR